MAKKPIVRNLTEEEEWKPWDPGNDKGAWGWASDNAWDDWKNLDDDECHRLVSDLVEDALTKKEQKRVTQTHIEAICAELHENTWDTLEATFHSILDAMQWAWEIAYTPNDDDIETALEKAKGELGDDIRLADYWDLVRSEIPVGPKEWSPRAAWTDNRIFKELEENITYRRKPKAYDRYLVFDWLGTGPVADMKAALKEHPEQGSPKDVEFEIEEWADQFMRYFFTELEKRMQGVETGNRVDFDSMWANVLEDGDRMKSVRKEILEFLKKPLPEPSEE
jgi:hypothetical protein